MNKGEIPSMTSLSIVVSCCSFLSALWLKWPEFRIKCYRTNCAAQMAPEIRMQTSLSPASTTQNSGAGEENVGNESSFLCPGRITRYHVRVPSHSGGPWPCFVLCRFGFFFFPHVLLQKHLKYFVQVCLQGSGYASENCGSGRLSQPLMLAGYKEWMTPTEVPTAIVSEIFIKANARGIKPTQGGLKPLSPTNYNWKLSTNWWSPYHFERLCFKLFSTFFP